MSWLATASLAGAAPSAPPAPQALQGAQVIALLNAQRTANGIPPITTLDQSFASWCPDEQAPRREAVLCGTGFDRQACFRRCSVVESII